MTQKVPHSPFTTRLSGSAKETELRLRNIFQWKKKRPPVILFILTAVLVLSCCSLVSCQVEPTKQTDDPDAASTPSDEVLESNATAPWTGHPFSSEAFFASYVTDFPKYTYTGAHSANVLGRTIELEDTPENFAEEMVWNNYWLPFVGNYEPYIALMGSEHMRISAENESELYADGISFSTVTVHTLSVLNTQDYGTTGAYFTDATVADRFLHTLWEDIHEYGLTEYTVAYIDLSWEWTQAALERGPQLGNGRYERLYLLGKTETDSDWKMYNIYWGEYDLNRILTDDSPASVLAVMTAIKAEDFIHPETFGNVTAEQLAAALNAAAGHQIGEAEFLASIGGAYGSVFPHWYIENAWLEGGPNTFSSLDRHLFVNCGLPENIVEVTLSENNHRDTAYFQDETLYQLIRHKDDYEETIDPQAYEQFKDLLISKMESALSLLEHNPGNFTGYELTRFTPVWQYKDPNSGNTVVLYDFFFGLLTNTPETVGWAGGMALDSKLRLVGLNVPVQFAVQYRENETRTAFMAPEFYYDPADTGSADWAKEHINQALNQATT